MSMFGAMPQRYGSARRTSPRCLSLKLASVSMLIACNSSTEPKGDLMLEGEVTNAANGAPVSGATVGVGDGSGVVIGTVQESTTNAQGRYTLSHPGCIRTPYVEVLASGYNYTSKPVTCKTGTQTVNFALTASP
jgi:hypothetical protein